MGNTNTIDEMNKVYLIDYGLATRFRDKNGNHRPMKFMNSTSGTLPFMSISAHEFKSLSRKDDLLCLLYTVIYLKKKKLPWETRRRFRKNSDLLYDYTLNKKINMKKKRLLKGLPEIYEEFYDYVNNMKFEEKPEYDKWM